MTTTAEMRAILTPGFMSVDQVTVERAVRRVVVADDDVLLRAGVAGLLERSGFEIAGQAGDAEELLAVVRGQRPDLVIVDIRMPPGHDTEGLEAARVIRRELPEVAILVLSAHVRWPTQWNCWPRGARSATCSRRA